jgi:hypothetical protein
MGLHGTNASIMLRRKGGLACRQRSGNFFAIIIQFNCVVSTGLAIKSTLSVFFNHHFRSLVENRVYHGFWLQMKSLHCKELPI